MQYYLQKRQKVEDMPVCQICLHPRSEWEIKESKCQHRLCLFCWKQVLEEKKECPFCRCKVRDKQIFNK